MAQPSLNQEDIKVLEQVRQRVFQLTNNIASLKSDVLRSNPLPPWYMNSLVSLKGNSLQTSASILASNIETLTTLMSKNADLLNRTVVYPSTNYPGRSQEAILTQLLRKKLEPSVESYVSEARTSQSQFAETATPTSEKESTELLNFALDWLGGRIVKYVTEDAGDYTIEERERGIDNVNTGLKRKLDEDASEEDDTDEDEDKEMEDVGVAVTKVRRSSAGEVEFELSEVKKIDPDAKMRNIEDILRFATTGVAADGHR
ncbi:related to Mediator of RNA polymerase II transcription subunit 8 [Rhynchosporium agropyri]|uniref:Mediator of RNA polymerase II transcription subunit 8 n=1 Tax=Rhynchosporium agropyri TaxID=914238 RepID=A0A1E1LP07_9HELO|nr:related to Mediator of RNA polymerase II transcription subunit 8 [Rhynchosporium agropyri]